MRRDAIIVCFLLVGIITLGFVDGVRRSRQASLAPLRRESTSPSGAKALYEWLQALDFEVSTQRLARYEIPDDVGAVLMLQPSTFVTQRELDNLQPWLEAGGSLIVAGSNQFAESVTAYFEFDQSFYFESETQQIAPMTLAMQDEIRWISAEIDPTATFDPDRDDFVTHLAVDEQPVVVSFSVGDGTVVLSTLWEPFSNSGLQRDGNPELVLNLLGLVEVDGAIWFDEFHHGDRATILEDEIVGPGAWVRQTRLGQAVLYSIALAYVVLLWQGRRFGRPVPLPDTTVRRAPLEYITAIANMNRRAGNRQAILNDYRLRLKKQLGARHRIDPALPDSEYLAILRVARPELDINAVDALLRRLRDMSISEADLVTLATDVSDFLTSD